MSLSQMQKSLIERALSGGARGAAPRMEEPAVLAAARWRYWRKWFYDTDNRAAQETGYLFEPILAAAIGGTPVSAARSPVRRSDDETKGRQVDCIKGKRAYEFKIRLTTAASGQGRWDRELAFPQDCASYDHIPVLVVLDDTTNPKLVELVHAFEAAGARRTSAKPLGECWMRSLVR